MCAATSNSNFIYLQVYIYKSRRENVTGKNQITENNSKNVPEAVIKAEIRSDIYLFNRNC